MRDTEDSGGRRGQGLGGFRSNTVNAPRQSSTDMAPLNKIDFSTKLRDPGTPVRARYRTRKVLGASATELRAEIYTYAQCQGRSPVLDGLVHPRKSLTVACMATKTLRDPRDIRQTPSCAGVYSDRVKQRFDTFLLRSFIYSIEIYQRDQSHDGSAGGV